MRKIKLELESLAVESFATAPAEGERGTVLANSAGPSGEKTCETMDPQLSYVHACQSAFGCTVPTPCYTGPDCYSERACG